MKNLISACMWHAAEQICNIITIQIFIFEIFIRVYILRSVDAVLSLSVFIFANMNMKHDIAIQMLERKKAQISN